MAHAGSIDELRAREANLIEVIATGADPEAMKGHLAGKAEVTMNASGLRIQVEDEKEVDAVIAALRKSNGKLVAVQPVKQSLEDLFLE